MFFASDNGAPVPREVMDAVIRANEGPAMPYGGDPLSERVAGRIRELFEADGVFAERLDRVATTYADLPEIMEIVAFIRADARRPLCLPGE